MEFMMISAAALVGITACALVFAVIAMKKRGGAGPKFAVAALAAFLALTCLYFGQNLVYNLPEEGKEDPLDTVLSETEPESGVETEAEAETVIETVPEAESEAITEIETELQAVPVPETEPEAETEAETEPETTPETEDEFAVMARESVGEVVDKVIELLEPATISGSTEAYPFEPRREFESLTESELGYYEFIRDSVAELADFSFNGTELGDEGVAALKAAYEAFRADYPRYTYYFRLVESDADGSANFSSHYFLPSDNSVTVTEDKEALLYDIACFEAVCDYIVESMPDGLCTYDKYRYLAAAVSLSTVYDHNGVGGYVTDTPYGPIMDGLAVCIGYTVAFEYLCERADLYCERVWGTTYNNLIHMWNLVKLDSGTYHVDVTWSDSDRNEPFQKNWQKYYMVTQENVLKNHIISDGTVATGTVEKFK